MQVYQSNHYSSIISFILDQCIESAKNNPFDIHYLIVDDEKYFEEIILKKIPYLFNIEIVSLHHFFQKIMSLHHQSFDKKSTYENIMEIVELIQNDKNSLFYHSSNLFQKASDLLEVFETFYLYEIKEKDIHLPHLSKKKIDSLFSLYHQFQKHHFLEYDFIESLIDDTDHQYYYFLLSSLDNKKIQKIIKKLDQFGHVYMYQAHLCQDNDYSHYLVNHLFDSYQDKKDLENPYEILKVSSIQEEIKQVVFDIYESLDHYHYHDFAIYYPNEDYYRHLTRVLDQFHIVYNKHEIIENKASIAFKQMIQYLIDDDENHLLDLISTQYIFSFQDIRYISLLKKQYLKQKTINDDLYIDLKKQLLLIKNNHTMKDFSISFIHFVEKFFRKDDTVYQLISFLQELNSDKTISIKEYFQIYQCLFKEKTLYQKTKIDSLYLLTYSQPYSELLQCQVIYCLGLNETIIPQEFKNTQLLLNEEAKTISYPTTYDTLKKHQIHLQNVFSNRHQRIILSYSLRDLKGNDLVVSSLIKKIDHLLPVKDFQKHPLLHQAIIEEFYLQGGYDKEKDAFNQRILDYKQFKHQVNHLQLKIDHNPLSASKLETYNQCPYKYFHQYLLKIDIMDDYRLKSHEIGTIVHYILEKNTHYFSNNKAKSFEYLKDDINKAMTDYLQKNDQLKYHLPQNQFFIQMIKDDLYNTIIVLSKQMEKGLFSLRTCEEKVYDQLDDIKLKGFIDRIDQYQDYIKVIDYKSSPKELNLDLARLGFKMQMLIYLEMFSKNNHLNKGAVLYFNTKKRLLKSDISILEKQTSDQFFKLYKMDGYTVGDLYHAVDHDMEMESSVIQVKLKKDMTPYQSSKIISIEDLDLLLHDITQHIQELYQSMIEGDIRIYPTRSESGAIDSQINPCSFCHYRPLCNFDVFYNENHMIQTGGNHEKR